MTNAQEIAYLIDTAASAEKATDVAEREYVRMVRELYYATTTGHGARPLGEVAALHKQASDALANWRKAQVEKQSASGALASIIYDDE